MSELRADMPPWPGQRLHALAAAVAAMAARGKGMPERAAPVQPPVRPAPRSPLFLITHTHWPACARPDHAPD
ncbi:hypothetical protein [Paracidovorax anthurii]|nr:hypothetical protein [Paracidovorax anthurii]